TVITYQDGQKSENGSSSYEKWSSESSYDSNGAASSVSQYSSWSSSYSKYYFKGGYSWTETLSGYDSESVTKEGVSTSNGSSWSWTRSGTVWDDGGNSWSESWSKSSWKDGEYLPGEYEVTGGSFDPEGTGTEMNNLPEFGEAPRLNKAPKQDVPVDFQKLPKPSDDIWELPTAIFKDSASKNTSGGKTFWLPTEIYKELLSQKVINGDGYLSVNNPTTLSRFEAQHRLALLILRVFYGEDADKLIQPGVLQVTDTKGILDAMDRANNWPSGKAKQEYGNLYGLVTNGRLFINSDLNTDDMTLLKTMVHEMLHINQNRNLTTTLGPNLMEGLTQRLAMQAFRASGRPWDDAGGYKDQVRVVVSLERLLGSRTLKEVYFNNPSLLATEFDRAAGFKLFDTFLQLIEQRKFDEAIRLIPF
ncbi:hypothetical protein, partial [Microcoleus sp. Z1_C3]|uniref:hypothetical protein n=1 Tax=unclassified Microcoleus TaxID=2642155 RepID=UPI002FD5E3D9